MLLNSSAKKPHVLCARLAEDLVEFKYIKRVHLHQQPGYHQRVQLPRLPPPVPESAASLGLKSEFYPCRFPENLPIVRLAIPSTQPFSSPKKLTGYTYVTNSDGFMRLSALTIAITV
jgi:hypothetical protein